MRIYCLSFSKSGRKALNIDVLKTQLSIGGTLTIHHAWQMMENVRSAFVRCLGPRASCGIGRWKPEPGAWLRRQYALSIDVLKVCCLYITSIHRFNAHHPSRMENDGKCKLGVCALDTWWHAANRNLRLEWRGPCGSSVKQKKTKDTMTTTTLIAERIEWHKICNKTKFKWSEANEWP